jgi:hypothetical protein
VGPSGFFAPLGVIPLAVMFRRRAMASGGIVMVLGRFAVGILGHDTLSSWSNFATARELCIAAFVP